MKMKKVKAVLAAFALIAMMPFQVMAADGSIMFSDLTEETGRSVKTGETAEISLYSRCDWRGQCHFDL